MYKLEKKLLKLKNWTVLFLLSMYPRNVSKSKTSAETENNFRPSSSKPQTSAQIQLKEFKIQQVFDYLVILTMPGCRKLRIFPSIKVKQTYGFRAGSTKVAMVTNLLWYHELQTFAHRWDGTVWKMKKKVVCFGFLIMIH